MPSTPDIPPLPALSEAYGINEWAVQPSLHRLVSRHETVRITPKTMYVLCCLAAQPGVVLSRDDLLGTVWQGTVVTDTVLSRAISELRKVFGDDATRPRVIETIPKIGYRLIAPVDVGERPLPASRPAGSSAPVRRPRVLRWLSGGVVAVLALGIVGFLLYRSEDLLRGEDAPGALRTVPLTATPGREYEPAFSPEGTRVAYGWKGDLYVRHVHGGEAFRLTDHSAEDSSPVWSPDGRVIAFVRRDEDTCAIYEVPALGGVPRRLTGCDPTAALTLAWSPDGQTLVFPERVDTAAASVPPTALVAFDLETAARRPLTTPPEGSLGDRHPVFSPDGRGVAFIRRLKYWADDLYVLALEDRSIRRVTSDRRSISGLDWTPDGRHLVWGSNRKGNYSLWRIRLGREETPEPLHMISSGVLNQPRLSRQGDRLVYENWSYESNIWRVPGRKGASGAGASVAIGSTKWELQPAIAPNGRDVAFVSTRSGSFELWVQRLDGSGVRQLTRFEGPFVGMPRWSPDSRRLAFVARTGAAADDVVYVLDLEDTEARALTEAASSSTVPSWNHDGTALYVGSDRSGTWQVWRHPLDGGEPVMITEDGGAMAYESSDGAWLYYNKPGRAALWQRPAGGGAETLLLDETTLAFDWWNWLSTDEGFYFIQPHDDGSATVVFFDRATRRATPFADVEHLGFSPGIAVDPEEAWFFYTRADRSEGDLVLVEHFEAARMP